MKCFTLITLVAGLTITSCAFGMDEARKALIDELATEVLSKFDAGNSDAITRAKRALEHATGTGSKGKLNVIKQMLRNSAFTDQANITSYTNRIDTLSNYTPPTTPTKTTPASPPSNPTQTTPPPVPAETPATDATNTEIKPLPAKSLLRYPLFIGAGALLLLTAFTYIYVQKQKTKKAKTAEDENESDQAQA